MLNLRTNLGATLITIGLIMLVVGIWHRKELWAGFHIKEVVKEVEKRAKAPVEDDGTEETGPVKIEYRYYTEDKSCKADKTGESCVANGQYQLRDSGNKIWMMKFCEPTPDLKSHGTYDIKYMKVDEALNCTRFVNATPLGLEPEK